MSIVTLTTGWSEDFYVAALKGVILSGIPSVQIVDISHKVLDFKTAISYAAHLVKHSYKFFPEKTIHIISVSSEYTDKTPFAAGFYDGQYFIGTDNGIFGLLFDETPQAMVRIEKYKDDNAPNFPAISVFAPAAVHLAKGGDIAQLGSQHPNYIKKTRINTFITKSQITGTITHINNFGNVITNITREDFDRVGKGRNFEILLQRTKHKITTINKYFHETSDGELLAVFNMSGYLELAEKRGDIAKMLKLEIDANIIVKFLD